MRFSDDVVMNMGERVTVLNGVLLDTINVVNP